MKKQNFIVVLAVVIISLPIAKNLAGRFMNYNMLSYGEESRTYIEMLVVMLAAAVLTVLLSFIVNIFIKKRDDKESDKDAAEAPTKRVSIKTYALSLVVIPAVVLFTWAVARYFVYFCMQGFSENARYIGFCLVGTLLIFVFAFIYDKSKKKRDLGKITK